jgi:hypothetical protein
VDWVVLSSVDSVPTVLSRKLSTTQSTRNKIFAHEGLHFEVGSHTQRYQLAATALLGPAMETIVGPDSLFSARWTATIVPIDTAIALASLQADVDNKINFGCNFNFTY